jgi:alkaline phosphatase D
MPLSRRDFLLGATSVAALAACSGGRSDSTNRGGSTASGTTTTAPVPPLPGQPFTLGVASGDPAAGSVVLWTRLAPQPISGGGMPAEDVPVVWEVATDDAFVDVVASGVVNAEARYGHSVHATAEGLTDGVDYRYRFRAGEFTSPVGRTRTPPADGASLLQFAFASCQDFQDGFWPVHAHLAEEQLDLVVWLGDYIYEGGVNESAVRQHNGPEPTTLEGYRNRYGLYKSDSALQAAHAARPWLVVWDDHEVDNNYAGDSSQDSVPADEFLERRAAAYQAWWEHMPVRLDPPAGATFEINRVLDWGGLASFFAIDTRQHRANQACGRASDLGESCPEVDDPARQILGAEQEAWLTEKMPGSSAMWNVLANQVIFSPSPIAVGGTTVLNLDQWDGYPAARTRMLDVLARTKNCVIITGDIHASAVGDVRKGDQVVATEFVGTSVSSSFPEAFVAFFESAAATAGALMADARHRGYVRCSVTPTSFTSDYRVVETTAAPSSPISTSSSFVITAGQPGVRKA